MPIHTNERQAAYRKRRMERERVMREALENIFDYSTDPIARDRAAEALGISAAA